MSDQSIFMRFNNDQDYVKLANVYSVCQQKKRDRGKDVYRPLKMGATIEHVYTNLLNSNKIDYTRVFQRILQSNGNIDYQLPVDSPAKFHSPELLGYTALHFAVDSLNESILISLLALGADVTVKNANGFTALRLAVERSYAKGTSCVGLMGTLDHPLAASILDAQIDAGNPANPKCNDGLSHLHIACMLDHVEAVEFFLQNGVSSVVDQSVPLTSKFLPGYTPLHLAARYCSIDTIQILLARGADVRAKDAEGMTPLHLLIDLKVQLAKYAYHRLAVVPNGFRIDLDKIEDAVELLLAAGADESISLDDAVLTRFHVACTRAETDAYERLVEDGAASVNVAIGPDSPFCAGYTPLHFAAHFNRETFLTLLRHGANISAKDAEGTTPVEIYTKKYGADELCKMLCTLESVKDVCFSNGDQLVDVLSGIDSFRNYLYIGAIDEKDQISPDSPVWPGCNQLHVIVHLAEFPVDDAILDRVDYGLDRAAATIEHTDQLFTLCFYAHSVRMLTQRDAGNATPLHLAFRQRKLGIVQQMARLYSFDMADPADDGDLSHSHIFACLGIKANISTGRVDLRTSSSLTRRTMASDGAETKLHFPAGSTALHMAITDGRCVENVKSLMARGADPSIKNDLDGMTPIHLAGFEGSYLTSLLLPHPDTLTENVTSNGGLSYFHIACHQSNLEAIKVYLKLGVDVDQPLLDDYRRYNSPYLSVEAGFTPLHLAVKGGSVDAARLLLEHGADHDGKSASGLTPLHLALRDVRGFPSARLLLTWLLDRDPGYTDGVGVTLLHVACVCADEDAVERLLKAGSSVEARIHDESPIFPGSTPLHAMLVAAGERTYQEEARVDRIAQLLLRHGADVGAKDALRRTPLHVLYDCEHRHLNLRKISLLLKSQTTTPLSDPCDATGLSHLHLAVLAMQEDEECVDVVAQYLREGADVRHATDLFRREEGGFAALHFAARYDTANVIEALVERGADVSARDRSGSSALYNLIAWPAEKYDCRYSSDKFHTIIKLDKSVANATNVLGVSPLEVLLYDPSHLVIEPDWIVATIASGARLRVYNPISGESMLGALVKFADPSDETFTNILLEALDSKAVDADTGGTDLHNVVSSTNDDRDGLIETYKWVIGRLLEDGVQLEHRNNEGKTALHVAAKFSNLAAIRALLSYGADVNFKDNAGLTPPLYAHARGVFMDHLAILRICQLDVDDLNRHYMLSADCTIKLAPDFLQSMHELAQCEIWRANDELFTMRDFVVGETGARAYPTMARSKREAVDRFRRDGASRLPDHFVDVFNLQHAKARERTSMMEAAKSAIALLAGAELPDPCSEGIIAHLRNIDLRVLVRLSDVADVVRVPDQN